MEKEFSDDFLEIMNYEHAMMFLESTKKYGSQLGLSSIKNLMQELKDVQDRIPVVHLAGTNGKGSVGAMLSAVCAEAGYKVGRFNTPDVFSYEEEFLMNKTPISREVLAQLFGKVAKACKRLVQRGLPHPTRFEVETAAAFCWFFEEQCDLAIVEVGMGGETDATNLIRKPLVSVLTSISMDHMNFLGDTLEQIASVKSGIIKRGCPVVSMQQAPEAMAVIRKKCEDMRAVLAQSDTSMARDVISTADELSFLWDVSSFSMDAACSTVPSIPTDAARLDDDYAAEAEEKQTRITLGVRGQYQIENAVCVLKVLEVLQDSYPRISRKAVLEGLKKVRWPGRFEQIHTAPDIYLDGAHNEDAVRKLKASVNAVFAGKRVLYIMGVLADKEYDRMIRIMFGEGDRVFTLTPPSSRALPAKELADILRKENIDAIPCENAKDAVSYALKEADADDVILVFGSLYYLNEVRQAFRDRLKEASQETGPEPSEESQDAKIDWAKR